MGNCSVIRGEMFLLLLLRQQTKYILQAIILKVKTFIDSIFYVVLMGKKPLQSSCPLQIMLKKVASFLGWWGVVRNMPLNWTMRS